MIFHAHVGIMFPPVLIFHALKRVFSMQNPVVNSEQYINHFTTRLRQLILTLKEVRLANGKLRSELTVKQEEIDRLRTQLNEANSKYEALKEARMLTIADDDVANAQKRINRLIRSVNQCITLLKEDDNI